jgi:hypothetical protein
MKVVFGAFILAVTSLAAHAQTTVARTATELVASTEKVVKGAPFSCEAVSESLQVLADGNRITRTSSNRMFRDSEGRFRREGIINPGSTLGAYFELQPTILILDPVNGFKYYLNSQSKTVKKLAFRLPSMIKSTGGGTYVYEPGRAYSPAEYNDAAKKLRAEIKAREVEAQTSAAVRNAQNAELHVLAPLAKAVTGQLTVAGGVSGATGFGAGSNYATRMEDLGTQTIEGVQAEGKRTITTIPAGAIGNERAIDIIYERWFSKDLDLIISSKHSDPRFGDQIFKLTNIMRVEPDSSLFTVPADFKVVFEQQYPKFTTAPTPKALPGPKPPAPPASAPIEKIII